MKKLSIFTSVFLSSFIVGCGSSNNSSNNSSTNNLEKNIKIADISVKIAPSNNNIINNKDAFTRSDLGIVTPVSFPKAKEINSSDETNQSVGEVINNTFKNKKNIYAVTNAKVIKIPFTSFDGKLAVFFKFNPKLPFDTTVAVTNYLTLLALPNNGLDLLKNGLEPIPEISGDIAFYNPNGDRKLDINKDFNSTNTTVNVSLLFKDLNLTEGKYKLYIYDYNGNYAIKDIEINKTNKNIAVAMNKISSFVIAKPDNNINEINETLNIKLPQGLKVGIVALNNNKVVGVGELKSILLNNEANQSNNFTFQSVEKATIYSLKKPSKYVYVSYFLKNGKKEVSDLKNLSIADFNTEKYPLDFSKLTSDDKNTLSQISNNQSYSFNWNGLSDFIHPEKLIVSQDVNKTFKTDVTAMIEDYITSGKCNNDLNQEYNASYNKVVVLKDSCDENGLLLNIKILDSDVNISKTISITKNNTNDYKINYQKQIPNHEKQVIDYTMIMKPYGRIIKNATQSYSKAYDDISYKVSQRFKEKLSYIGGNNYHYSYTEQYHSSEKEEANQTNILNYNVSGNAKLYYNNENNSTELLQHTYEVSNLYSNDENITINGKNFVYDYSAKTQETTVNGNPLDEIMEY